MCNFVCSVITAVLGGILVIGSCLISFLLVPSLVEDTIINEVILLNDTIQYERFETVPFPLNFKVTVMEITNPEEVIQGRVPIMREVGPYVYKLYQSRNITYVDEDILRYYRMENFEFDAEASYPLTENDMVTMVNVPYHAIIQIAEQGFPELVSALNLAMSNVFGVHNTPITTFRVRDLFFDGVRICVRPGLLGAIPCGIIRSIGATAQNLVEQPDGSMIFSLLAYKDNIPSEEYEVYRGLEDPEQLGLIRTYGGMPYFRFWTETSEEDPGICNMVNGTDSGIFSPFVDKEKSLYAINTDICRSVELRYQYDVDVDGIPTNRFSANEWMLDNNQGCFCLNNTVGINREDGCLLAGAMELYSCVGAMLVLTYPHFLYADMRYRNGVIGMAPNEENHRIFIDIEPNTGTPIRGAKRAQFNVFLRPVRGISQTANLRTTLTPVVWIEESIDIPDEFKDELRSRLLRSLDLLEILIPVIITICCIILVIGLVLVWRSKRKTVAQSPQDILETR